MKLYDIKITAGEKIFIFRGVSDIRIVKNLSFTKAMKLKGGPEYKLRYTFDLQAFDGFAMIAIFEAKKKEQRK